MEANSPAQHPYAGEFAIWSSECPDGSPLARCAGWHKLGQELCTYQRVLMHKSSQLACSLSAWGRRQPHTRTLTHASCNIPKARASKPWSTLSSSLALFPPPPPAHAAAAVTFSPSLLRAFTPAAWFSRIPRVSTFPALYASTLPSLCLCLPAGLF